MTVKTAVAEFAANTSSGTQDLTTTDLGGLVPKGAILTMTYGTANGTLAADTVWTLGWSDGSTSQALCWNADDAVTTTDTGSRFVPDVSVISNATDQTVEARAEFSAWITNGIRINWPVSETPASAFLIKAWFIAGDVSVAAGSDLMNQTVGNSVSVTTPGFEPDILFGMGMIGIADAGVDANGGHWRSTWGVAVNDGSLTQRSIGCQNRNGVTTSDSRSSLNNNYWLRAVANTGASFEWGLEITSFDASGFTMTTRDGVRADTEALWMAIKLDGIAQFSLQSYATKSGTTGEQSDTTPGFTPETLLFGMTMAEAENTIDTGNTIGGVFGIGFASESVICSTSWKGDSGVTTTDEDSLANNKLDIRNENGTAGVVAAIPTGGIMDATGFTLDFTTVETNAKRWWALAIENSTGSAPMGRMYNISGSLAGVTTARDLLRVSAPSDAIVVVHRLHVTQETEFGDAASEQIDIVVAKASTDGSGGSTVTARPLENGDAAFGGTAVAGNTTQSTQTFSWLEETWPVQGGFYWVPTPEEKIVLSPSERIVVELNTAPDDSIDFRYLMVIEEIGG